MTNFHRNKGGRPALPGYKKRDTAVKVRFSTVDMIYLRSCANECGLRLAEYVYRAAMNQKTTAVLTPEEHILIRDIRNIGNNLNQITRAMHLGDHVEYEIYEIIRFISAILRKIKQHNDCKNHNKN